MPLDDYTSSAGGALKIKGAKVSKSKKKKKKDKTDLEKNLSGGEGSTAALSQTTAETREEHHDRDEREVESGDEAPVSYKTAAERRHEDAKRKRVRAKTAFSKWRGFSFSFFLSLFSPWFLPANNCF
jgi:protein FAM32A